MNHSVIRFTMGRVLFIFGFLLMAPLLVALLYREPLRFVASWTVAIGLCMVLAMVCLYRPPEKSSVLCKRGLGNLRPALAHLFRHRCDSALFKRLLPHHGGRLLRDLLRINDHRIFRGDRR